MLLALTILADIPVPVSGEFAAPLLLVILWILVAAAVIGPVARFLHAGRTLPRSTQPFAEDAAERP